MNEKRTLLVLAIMELFGLVLSTLLVPLILMFDIMVLGNEVGELSVTEITQEILLLLTVVVCAIKARRHPEARGLLLLAAGFFACMLVRELDALFDLLTGHGSWRWFAAATALVAVLGALANRTTIIPPLIAHLDSKAHLYETVGLVIVLVFSRSMGSGGFFWKQIIGVHYLPLMKTALQEGLELFGYLFIFYGACLFGHPSLSWDGRDTA